MPDFIFIFPEPETLLKSGKIWSSF